MEVRPERIRKKNPGNFPSTAVVISLSLSLFVLCLFGFLAIHAFRLSQVIQNEVELQIYLSGTLTTSERDKIIKAIVLEPFVDPSDRGNAVTLITKEEAAKEFIQETGEDFSNFLGENPLKDLIRVKLKPEYADAASLLKLKQSIEKRPGIHEVTYIAGLAEQIKANLLKIGLVAASFATVLAFVAVALIHNTIKLAFFSQRFLIRSMQLIGATHAYVQWPFLKKAMINGLIAALLAFSLSKILVLTAYEHLPDLKPLSYPPYEYILGASLLLTGILLSVLSTLFATRKYLRVSLDELY
jgi:cell division transport system permease protein